MKIFNLVSAVLLALVLGGCDGDARPFEEAVEVRTENLNSIAVVPPALSVDKLVMNIGESAQFGVQATSVMGQTVALSASDRFWQVTDDSRATIDADGRLVAKADGPVGVFISIGGLVSETYDLKVSDSTLVSIQNIVGEPIIERCLPEDYQATGLYEDTSIRDLVGVDWSLAAGDADNARRQNNPDTTVTVTGLNAGAVTLTAALDGLSTSLPIEISDSLTSLEISPASGRVEVDGVATFVAFAEFADATPDAGSTDTTTTTRTENVTASVDWQIASGSDYASVTNTQDSRGVVTGLASGSATLLASCGNFPATPVVVTVNNRSNVTDQLSFLQTSPISLVAGNASRTLSVSTGSTYSSANGLDNDDLTWELSADDVSNPAVSLVDNGVNAGRITPLVIGGATITVTDSDGATGSIRVEVTSN